MSYPPSEWNNYNEDDYAQDNLTYDYQNVQEYTYNDYLQPATSYHTDTLSTAPLDAQYSSYYSPTSPTTTVHNSEYQSYHQDYSQQTYSGSMASPSTGYASTSGYDVAYDYETTGADQVAGTYVGYPTEEAATDYHTSSTAEGSRTSSRKHSDKGKQPQQSNRMRSTKTSSGQPPKDLLNVFHSNPEPTSHRKPRKTFKPEEKKKVEAVRAVRACQQCSARKRSVSF